MTKKKAIEAAYVESRKDTSSSQWLCSRQALAHVFDAGRIAGLRQAARFVAEARRNAPRVENLCVRSAERIANAIEIVTRDYANALAKKARAKQ